MTIWAPCEVLKSSVKFFVPPGKGRIPSRECLTMVCAFCRLTIAALLREVERAFLMPERERERELELNHKSRTANKEKSTKELFLHRQEVLHRLPKSRVMCDHRGSRQHGVIAVLSYSACCKGVVTRAEKSRAE